MPDVSLYLLLHGQTVDFQCAPRAYVVLYHFGKMIDELLMVTPLDV